MSKILVCWVGNTDLRAAEHEPSVGLGPIGRAVKERRFDSVSLISNYSNEKNAHYREWLQALTEASVKVAYRKLTSPMDFGEVYETAVGAVQGVVERFGRDAQLVYHLSPGTPVMAAVWIILSKTRYPAELIESSPQYGVKTAAVPFDISAE